MKEDAPQRTHSLRDVFNALRWLVRAGCYWRMMPQNRGSSWRSSNTMRPREDLCCCRADGWWSDPSRGQPRDYERLATIMAGYHWVAFTMLMLQTLFRKSQ
ncbi:MAG: hypothetical protein RI897_3385 [Verrucomicrobiota bacterium]